MKNVHTMIERPTVIRRSLLEAAIDATEILKFYENIHDIKEKKEEVKKQIKLNLVRLNRFSNALKKAVPQLPKDLDNPRPVKVIELPKKYEEKLPATSKEKIEKQLRELRNRIHNLKV
ncbi:MAG: hypothetical protein AABW87_00055 [Nanoarchaeota archaeon]